MKITNFFSHDSNARNDEKIINLRMSLGAEGYGIYFMILERLREESNYMSIKDYNMLAFDLRVDASKVKKVIEDFGLFVFETINGIEYIYSESFMRRMEIKDDSVKARSDAGKKGALARWGNGKNGSAIKNDGKAIKENSNAMAMPSKNIASKESKERKESKKVNIHSELDEFLDKYSDELKNAFIAYAQMRGRIGRPITGIGAVKDTFKDLESLGKTEKDWISILNQSSKYAWVGLYGLKDKKSTDCSSSMPKNKTEFTEYGQRDYDFKKLETLVFGVGKKDDAAEKK